jgi:AcrR family transcriptional regulator
MKATGARRATRVDPPATRERILREASVLIAQRGYRATTTRQIAERVGIQQPSLFHHFASKAEIVGELLSWDLGQTLPFVRELASQPTSAPIRLYAYLVFDIDHLMTAPYNLAGIFTEDVMSDPAFAVWANKRDQVHTHVEEIVAAGVSSGEFLRVNPRLISEAIAGVLVGVLTFHSGGRKVEPELADEIASVLVRGLLTDPLTLPSIRAAAADADRVR